MKKLLSVVTVIIFVLNLLVTEASATLVSLPAPEYTETPELLYQISKPDGHFPFYDEDFIPPLKNEICAEGVPVISAVTSFAKPGETIVLEGDCISDAELWIYGVNRSGCGELRSMDITERSESTVSAMIPYQFSYGVYLVWAENAAGAGYPVRVNAPIANWLSDLKGEPGQEISIYGKNFCLEEKSTKLYMSDVNGKNIYLEPLEMNPYKVTFVLPQDTADGKYKIWIHNGNGAGYGWSNALSLEVDSNADKRWTGKTITIDKNKRSVSVDSGEFSIGGSERNYRLQIGEEDLLINLSTTQTRVYTETDGRNYLICKNRKIYISIEGNTIIVGGGDQELFEVANCIAENRDTVFIKNGSYVLNSIIRVVQGIRFVGESRRQTVITASFGSEVNQDNVNNNTLFLIMTAPAAFQNLTFRDDVNSTFSPNFIYVNVYSEDGTSGWVRDGFDTEFVEITGCDFIKEKTYCSDDSAIYDIQGFQSAVTVENPSGGQQKFSASTLVSECVTISSAQDITVSDCYFEAPRGMSVRSSFGVKFRNNTGCGTWIMDGSSGPCFIQFFSADNIDCSNNIAYGYDKVTDPNGELQKGDQAYNRVFVLQNPSKGLENIYIGNNSFERCGIVDDNSGEQIMFEGLGVLYQGKPSGTSQNSIRFCHSLWSVEDDENAYINGTSTKLAGQVIFIGKGKGKGQYRTIKKVVEESGEYILILDRAWDIVPDYQSTVMLLKPFKNSVVYQNKIKGPGDYYSEYNATAGIQAYGSMLDFVVDENSFGNLYTGVVLTTRYANEDSYDDFNESDGAFFRDVIVTDNQIKNIRNGVLLLFHWRFADGQESFTDETNGAETAQGIVIRNNVIDNCVDSPHYTLEGIGGDGISVGLATQTYATWGENKLPSSSYIYNTVIEGNTISNCENAAVRLCYAQENTLLRGNNLSGNHTDIQYEKSKLPYSPAPKPYIYDFGGTYANGVEFPIDQKKISSHLNGDFSEGLRQWGTIAGVSPSSFATVIDESLHFNSTKLNREENSEFVNGLKSTFFRVDRTYAGKYLALKLRWRGDSNFKVEVYQGERLISSASPQDGDSDDWTVFISDGKQFPVLEIGDSDVFLSVEISENGEAADFWIDDLEVIEIEPVLGSAADGVIKETGEELTELYVDAADFSNDFAEGLRYWGASDRRTGKASDFAKIDENGVLKVHYNTASDAEGVSLAKQYDGIQSVRVRLPEELRGKEIGFIAEIEKNADMSACVYRPDGQSSTYSYTYNADDNSARHKIYTKIQTSATDEYVYFVLNLTSKPEESPNKEYSVYNFTIGYVNSQGIFTDFSGALWNTGYQYNTPYYGTEENGIFIKKGDDIFKQNLIGRDVFNGDFSHGLKYWAPYGTDTDAYASEAAAVEDGELIFTASELADSYYKLVSAGINIPEDLTGKKIGVAFDMDSPIADMQIHVFNADGGNMTGKGVSKRDERAIVYTGYMIGETDEKIHIRIQQDNGIEETRGAVSKIDNIIIFVYDYENEKTGYTLNGNAVNLDDANGYYTYGSESKGIYIAEKAKYDGMNKIPSLSECMNFDFSEGLKYWGPRTTQFGYASEHGTVEGGVLRITDKSFRYDGLRSVRFRLPEQAKNQRLYISCDIQSNVMAGFKLHTDKSEMNDWKILSNSTYGEWLQVVTDEATAVQLSDSDTEIAFEFQLFGKEDKTGYVNIDNIKICLKDKGGMNLLSDLYGAPVNYEYGDINADSNVDIKDLIRLKKYLADKQNVKVYCAAANTDKSRDLEINALDLAALRKQLLGL